MVFHDPVLDRMTDAGGAVWDRTADELCDLVLAGSGERIPRLSQVLAALPSGTPVLAELKASPGAHEDYIGALDLALFGARAEVAVMSFIVVLRQSGQSSPASSFLVIRVGAESATVDVPPSFVLCGAGESSQGAGLGRCRANRRRPGPLRNAGDPDRPPFAGPGL